MIEKDSQVESGTLQWSTTDKGDYIEYQNGFIRFTGTTRTQTSLIRTTKPIPSSSSNFYFEVKVVDRGSGSVAIGLTTYLPESRNLRRPGDDPGTIGLTSSFYTSTGESAFSLIYHGQKAPIEKKVDPIVTDDVLGCHLKCICVHDVCLKICYFKINGKQAGKPRCVEGHVLFPTIGMNSPGAVAVSNFGEDDFVHNIKGII